MNHKMVTNPLILYHNHGEILIFKRDLITEGALGKCLPGKTILTTNKHMIFFRETELEFDAFPCLWPRGTHMGLS